MQRRLHTTRVLDCTDPAWIPDVCNLGVHARRLSVGDRPDGPTATPPPVALSAVLRRSGTVCPSKSGYRPSSWCEGRKGRRGIIGVAPGPECLEGCPHSKLAERRVTVLTRLGRDEQTVTKVLIETPEGAVRLGFIGSPTVLVDGRNPFARGDEQPASACRVFLTPNGPDGAPPWISCWRQWFSRPGFPWSLTRHRTSSKEMVKHEPFPGPGLDAVSPP